MHNYRFVAIILVFVLGAVVGWLPDTIAGAFVAFLIGAVVYMIAGMVSDEPHR